LIKKIDMKNIKRILFVAIVAILTSCASASIFPISEVVPAAEITAKKVKQGKWNYQITLTALNLASPERLTPAKKMYVIWAVSPSGTIRNVGFFNNINAEKSIYKASFPYEPMEIFITAEDEEDLCKPNGVEVTRVKLQ